MPIFINHLKKRGQLDNLRMTVCIVGSRKLFQEDDYGSNAWGLFGPRLTIYGFDADANACLAANTALEKRKINWTEKHIPLALGKSIEEKTIYVTNHPMCSSLYTPNEDYLRRFNNLPEVFTLNFTVEVQIATLDSFVQAEGIKEIDFLQMDVQGAELQVLEGATNILERSILAVQTEVEFSHLYLKQPLFSDIDIYLRQQGFTLFDLMKSHQVRRDCPVYSEEHPGQLLWGEAFYLRDLLQPEINSTFKNADKILKMACIADILNFSDYATELLEYLTLNYGQASQYNCANAIIQGLAQFPELIDHGLNSFPVVANIRDYVTDPELLALCH